MITSEIEDLLNQFLSRHRGSSYGLGVTRVANDLSTIHATIAFLSGRTYCCAEPFCHVPRDLSKFVRFAAERGFVLPPQLEIHWHFIVEEGSLLSCNKAFGTSLESRRQEYDEVSAVHHA